MEYFLTILQKLSYVLLQQQIQILDILFHSFLNNVNQTVSRQLLSNNAPVHYFSIFPIMYV
jgi:hypothetical protein